MTDIATTESIGKDTDGTTFSPSTSSERVFVGGNAIIRVGDGWIDHNDDPPHTTVVQIGGSTRVFENGTPVASDKSQISCGGAVVASSNVKIN